MPLFIMFLISTNNEENQQFYRCLKYILTQHIVCKKVIDFIDFFSDSKMLKIRQYLSSH